MIDIVNSVNISRDDVKLWQFYVILYKKDFMIGGVKKWKID